MQTSTPAFIPQTPKPVAVAPVVQPTQPSSQPVKTITASDGTVLDAGVVNLSKAIRQQESGGNYNAVGDNGTSHGAYQWNKDHFSEGAKQFRLDPTDFSPVNQDKVAYAQINAYKEAGYSPEQIASVWNSGKKDPTGNQGTAIINGKPVNYDTPKYVANVMGYFNQNKSQNPGQAQDSALTNQTQTTESPSVGSFAKNFVQSSANLVGNIGEALLHPINTIQNIGGAAVGGLQELGGQDNENTQKFDALKDFYVQRYGSIDKLLHTAYTDPVGLAADISTVFGIGGGVAGALGKGAELAGAGNLARTATEASGAIKGAGVAGTLGDVASTLGKGAALTNPLTPLVKGASALLNKTKNLSDVIANPKNYTPENIASATGEKIANDVQSAFSKARESLSETGSAYTPFKETPTTIKTSADFLDNTLRDSLKLGVKDGIVEPTSTSLLRNPSDIAKLQGVYNTYKSDFLNGTMDSEKFLNLRTDLAKTAFNDLGIKNTDVAQATAKVRGVLNDTYRDQVPNLTKLDKDYATKINKINELEDGLVYKTGAHKGELKDSFISKAGKALKTEDADKLAQLEEISPGITKRLQIMKTVKELGSPGFTTTIAEKGGVVGGIITGNIQGAALALSSIIISQPEIALPLLRAVGASLPLVKAVMANLAKYTTLSVTGNSAIQSIPQIPQQQTDTVPLPQTEALSGGQNENQIGSLSSPDNTINTKKVQDLSGEKNFNYAGAKKAGHTDEDIYNYLKNE